MFVKASTRDLGVVDKEWLLGGNLEPGEPGKSEFLRC